MGLLNKFDGDVRTPRPRRGEMIPADVIHRTTLARLKDASPKCSRPSHPEDSDGVTGDLDQ